jgi:hypothetical protein
LRTYRFGHAKGARLFLLALVLAIEAIHDERRQQANRGTGFGMGAGLAGGGGLGGGLAGMIEREIL